MVDNQMQKLSLENCTLQLEVKLIKDKYNRCTAHVSELEARLQEAQTELKHVQTKLEEELSHLKQSLQADIEKEVQQHKMKAATCAKEVEILKSEISFMEEQFGAVKRECETIRHNMDKSKIYDTHRQEVQTFQDEIANLKHLLEESEHALEAESVRCKDFVDQVQRLTEVQEVFQLQMEETSSGGSAAEKQMASLQMRLSVTEERLSQERADRAGNLSQIEEKLLSENAKLQTKTKELDRQLKRDKEKSRTLEQRANELREENLQLRLAAPDDDDGDKSYSIPYSRRKRQQKNSDTPACNITEIWKQLESEIGVPCAPGDMESLVLYLWDSCQDMKHKFREWHLYFEELELPEGEDCSISLQHFVTVKTECEAKMQQTEEKFEDITAEKITAEQIYKQQLTDLVKERHEAFARLKTLEDLMDALRAENEALRQSLAKNSGHSVARPRGEETGDSGQLETLRAEIAGLESNSSQLTRRNKVLESEINTLRCQLVSRDKELTETFTELKSVQVTPKSDMVDDQFKHQRILSLTSEVASLKEDLHFQSEKHLSVQTEKHRLETQLREVKDELQTVQKRNREQDLDSSLTQKSEMKKLEADLEKKDEELLNLTIKLNENETSLFIVRSELALQQKSYLEMKAQLESNQLQLDQRCLVIDALSAKETDQLGQLEMVMAMIYTLNQGIASKQGEFEILQLELQQANAKIAMLQEQNDKLAITVQDTTTAAEISTKSNPIAVDLRVGEMKFEKEMLEAQLMQSIQSLTNLKEDSEVLNAEVSKVKQEASAAMANSTKMTNENSVLERRVKTLEEEKELMKEEKDNCKRDINRLETSLHEVVSKFESEAEFKLNELSAEYSNNSSGEEKLSDQLHTIRLMMFVKEKENGLIMDKVKRQEQELRNFERLSELLQGESEQSKKDVNRITDELLLQVRENAAAVELNRMFLKEQASLQKQLSQVEKQMKYEKEKTEHRKAEIIEVIKKIDHSEQVNLATSLTQQKKDSIISDQEVRLRQLSHDLNQIGAERDSLRAKVDELTESLRSLSNVSSGLEHKLEAKDVTIRDEQSAVSKQKEQILTLNHRLEVLKHEHALLLSNLGSEKNVQDKLKENIKTHEKCKQQLNDKLAELTQELQLQKGQLVAAREIIQQTKSEKETIFKDYQDVCRRLGEKDSISQEVQQKKEEEIFHVKQDLMMQIQTVSLERVNSERDLGQLKQEVDDLKNQLQRKEDQLTSSGQTLSELEDAKRKIVNLESYAAEQNRIAAETKILIESLRNELFSVRDKNAELYDTIARKEVVIIDLKDKLHHCEESTETHVIDLKHTIEGMRSHHEYEKKSMRESHSKVEENLKLSMQEILALREAQDHLTEQAHSQEKLIAEANYKLSQEEVTRRYAEDKLNQFQANLDDLTRKKTALEENVNRLQLSLNKTETEYIVVRERAKYLAAQLKNVQVALTVSEGAVKDREEKIENLKTDYIRRQQMLENHREHSTNTLYKLDLERKQQVESQEKDHMKLSHQAHQLSVDLEQTREIIVIKNKENLQLQERVLELENRLREGETRLKHTENSLRQEEEMQSRLINRFEGQESELKKLRNFLAQKADEGGEGKGMWQEINHVLSEMSRQFQLHIETSRLFDQGGKDDSELVHKLRRSLLETESQLNTERALHAVTRSSMQALEEDCTRLRQTISAIRRRGLHTEKKQKSRMEEISAIIARSQTRAQALLTSGEFSLDGSLRNLNPSRDYNVGDASFSPDTSFASDTSYSGANLANLSFLDLSGNLGAFSPRK